MTKSVVKRYIERSIIYPPFILEEVNSGLQMIVVIPCFKEESILDTLEDLIRNQASKFCVEVIVVVNDGHSSSKDIVAFNDLTFQRLKDWSARHSTTHLKFFPIRVKGLPKKHAGVGLARKIGLDEGVRRLKSLDKEEGVLICLDADSRIATNYLKEVEDYFIQHPKHVATAIHFEHPVDGEEFDPIIYDSIIQYELHLRYFIDMQRKLNLPFAVHTVGSSMAVRVNAYCALGGMNKRKAGEDFYFYHKFVKYGPVGEIYKTCVIPSPRVSDRVPFGTGKAVGDLMEEKTWYTYHPMSFNVLAPLLNNLKVAYKEGLDYLFVDVHRGVRDFFVEQKISDKWQEIQSNTSGGTAFRKRFFNWFDAFLFMKYLHFMKDTYFPNIPISEAMERAYEALDYNNLKECLLAFRKMDKKRHVK